MNLKKEPDQIAVHIVWKSICHISCDGDVCCPLTLSPCACVVATRRQAQLRVLVPVLQSSHLAQTHPTSVHACGLSALENFHMETLKRQHGPNLVFSTTHSTASLHTLTITRPCPETSQQLKHSVSSWDTLSWNTM